MNAFTSSRARLLAAGLVALAAWLAIVATLDPNVAGPGLTIDEYYYAAHGKRLVLALAREQFDFFRFASINRNFAEMHEHPPLAALCLGATHALFDGRPEIADLVWVPGARLASATGFAVVVFLLAWRTGHTAGLAGGTAAGAALALSPRAFAHAHFAALDTLTMAFCFVAVIALNVAVVHAVEGSSPPKRQRILFAIAGFAWGLAMLTKLNGLLLGLPLTIWIVWSLRGRGIVPLLIWGATGLVTFFVGWPWLWPAPVSRLAGYLISPADRTRLMNFYLGESWPDIATPWHYPWVMAAVTIPLGFLALGLLGATRARHSTSEGRFTQYLLLNLVCLLGIFSVPGVPVYDGARLFLLVFPLWCALVGVGAAEMLRWKVVSRIPSRAALAGLLVFVAVQGFGIVRYYPAWLSYYNATVGGLAGAERMGFEANYWGDAVDRNFLLRVRDAVPGERVILAPTLVPWQISSEMTAFPLLQKAGIELQGYSTNVENEAAARYAIVFRRRADEESVWGPLVEGGDVLVENARDGVWLARLYRLPRERR